MGFQDSLCGRLYCVPPKELLKGWPSPVLVILFGTAILEDGVR